MGTSVLEGSIIYNLISRTAQYQYCKLRQQTINVWDINKTYKGGFNNRVI